MQMGLLALGPDREAQRARRLRRWDITPGPPSVSRAVARGGMAAAMIVAGLTGAL